jgi:prepilin-type processing-associated H-X9-DG protein
MTPPPTKQDNQADNDWRSARREPYIRNRPATVAMVLAFIGIFFPPLELIVLILALVTFNKVRNDPRLLGRGFALTGIIVSSAVIFLSLAIGIPALSNARELSNRMLCAENFRNITRSMIVYASDNVESFPFAAPTLSAAPATDTTGNGVMAGMYLLVSNGALDPKTFICKSDPAGNPISTIISPQPGKIAYWTHPSGGDPNLCYSYSFAFQFTGPTEIGRWWRTTMDSNLPLAADMNPGDQNPRPIKNSLNHRGDGQNIAFADGHVEFRTTPCAGENGDHIYTSNIANNPAAPGIIGQLPFANPGHNQAGSFDTCLIPGLADTTHYTRK